MRAHIHVCLHARTWSQCCPSGGKGGSAFRVTATVALFSDVPRALTYARELDRATNYSAVVRCVSWPLRACARPRSTCETLRAAM